MSDTTPYTYIVSNELWKKQLVVLFTVLIVLAVFMYYAIYFTQNWENTEVLSRATFDLLINRVKHPAERNFLTTGDTTIDPSNFTVADLDILIGLQECPENECAIDIETGVKRCPENGNVRVVYNNSYESCTSKYFCTSKSLPYAILSSGETDTFGVCDDDVVCRCTNKIACPNYVTATINLRNGNNYLSRNEMLNYYFIQRAGNPNSVTGYEGITIESGKRNKEFCTINPSYSDRMDTGCDFTNTDSDILGCQDSQDFYQIPDVDFTDQYGSDFNFYYQNTSDYKTQSYSNTLNIQSTNKPQKGFSVYDDGNGVVSIIDFSNLNEDSITFGNDSGTVVSGISSIKVSGNDVGIDLGMPPIATQQGNGYSNYKFSKIIFTGCRNSGLKSTASNRNMLLCLQPNTQPCNNGTFTYIVKDKEPTNFCRFTQDFLKSRENLNLDMLDDPKNYTLSCVNGNGCLPEYSTSFCEGDICDTIISKRKESFFPSYDSSAVSNVWVLTFNNNPRAGVITYTYNVSDGIVLSNDGMMSIEKGDYYSTSSQIYTKLVSVTVDVSTQFTLNIGNVDGLVVGYLIFYPDFKGQIESIPTSTSVVVNKLDGNATEITEYTLIRFFSKVDPGDDGNRYGRFWVDDDGKIFPAKITEDTKYVWNLGAEPLVIFVYKQFGFNGINYNTELSLTYNNNKMSVSRRYSSSSKWYYWMYDKPSRFITPPLSSDIIPLSRTVDSDILTRDVINAISFSDPDADFKKNLSFYYPVWNTDMNQQVCSLCTPNTITYSKIIPLSPVNSLRDSLFSAVIQFSGIDYSQYMYSPILTFNPSNNYVVGRNSYTFNIFTGINENLSTTRRIVLTERNPNIPLSSEVEDNYYVENKYTLLDSSNIIRRKIKFVLPANGLPPQDIVNLSLLEENMSIGQHELIMLDNRFPPYIYNDTILNLPTSKQSFLLDGSNTFYRNYSKLTESNYFGGKIYYYQDIQLFVESDVSIVSVELNGQGEQVIITDSKYNVGFSGETDIILQVISHNDTLDVDYKPKVDTESLYVNGITQGRITDFRIADGGKDFFISNLPNIVLTKYRRVE